MLPALRRIILVQGVARRGLATSSTVQLAYYKQDPDQQQDGASPLIIMHGLFGSKQNWRSLSKAFARDLNRQVFCLDLRNHGDSPHTDRHDYESMAGDVAAFIQEQKLDSPILMGHSMGAKVAMTLALQNPDLVHRLIAVDNAPVNAILSRDFARYVRAMKRIDQAKVSKQSEADEILKEDEQNIGIRQFLLTNMFRDPETKTLKFRIPLDVLAKSLDRMGEFPYLPETHRYAKPTLFVRGTTSHYVPDDIIPLIGRFFPRFTLNSIEAGHWVQAEKPNEFKEAVETWIKDQETD
ncbi:hypothetical protein G7K_0129-t1 [Saitoella complicata NRRL Y-17804]|uniref:AB hydrolase-1 domain-containing protein n=2 Tax=Saitoella complicata (strain BCRC 22490 / CBS 7301 / JCM 7358 / NBRC 10748 / NRRL Y-17804) TaxID=698492 RepID=A0A0E9N7X0_SAICN|nr:hypothetical protein G7K_0129-t1 [Saitoella complicata NRRL Y-17804]